MGIVSHTNEWHSDSLLNLAGHTSDVSFLISSPWKWRQLIYDLKFLYGSIHLLRTQKSRKNNISYHFISACRCAHYLVRNVSCLGKKLTHVLNERSYRGSNKIKVLANDKPEKLSRKSNDKTVITNFCVNSFDPRLTNMHL